MIASLHEKDLKVLAIGARGKLLLRGHSMPSGMAEQSSPPVKISAMIRALYRRSTLVSDPLQ